MGIGKITWLFSHELPFECRQLELTDETLEALVGFLEGISYENPGQTYESARRKAYDVLNARFPVSHAAYGPPEPSHCECGGEHVASPPFALRCRDCLGMLKDGDPRRSKRCKGCSCDADELRLGYCDRCVELRPSLWGKPDRGGAAQDGDWVSDCCKCLPTEGALDLSDRSEVRATCSRCGASVRFREIIVDMLKNVCQDPNIADGLTTRCDLNKFTCRPCECGATKVKDAFHADWCPNSPNYQEELDETRKKTDADRSPAEGHRKAAQEGQTFNGGM
jgi:hypothetical protein